jgi:aromatic ring-opening dioxygenase catalytic subunit (LigB family)
MHKASAQPAIFIPHGGGPCFFMDWDPPDTWQKMEAYLASLAASLPQKPSAMVVVSAHWEEDVFTVASNPQPDLIYDYHGFPAHTYDIKYPAPGNPSLAARIAGMLTAAGLPARIDDKRGFDHGVFIPLKVAFPAADIPIVALSLKTGLDPAEHIALGRALAPLRDENILIIGSGMSYHNLRRFFGGRENSDAQDFDSWLTAAATAPAETRNAALAKWETAPAARSCHPREEHLLPLMVSAGAGGEDLGRHDYSDKVMGLAISGYRFG